MPNVIQENAHKLFLFVIFILLLVVPKKSKMSKTIVIIRHAEKHEYIDNKPITSGFKDNHHLSKRGYERAEKLVEYFHSNPHMVKLFKTHPLETIIAQDVDLKTSFGLSERPKETIIPLCTFD
jgi:hypothetical protein